MNINIKRLRVGLSRFTVLCFGFYPLALILANFYGVLTAQLSKFILIAMGAIGVLQYLLVKRGGTIALREVLGLSLILLMVVAASLQYLFFSDISNALGNQSAHEALISFTLSNICWLWAGYAVATSDLGHRSNTIALIVLCAVALLMFGVLGDGATIKYWELKQILPTDSMVSHLTLGDALYLVLILAYAYSKYITKCVIFLISTSILFVNGGRSDLMVYIVVIALYELLNNKKFDRRVLTISFAALPVIIVWAIGFMPQTLFDMPGVSHMVFTGGIENDSSFQGRINLLAGSLDQLFRQAPFGDVALLVRENGSFGSYVHNLLSAWQFYGVAAFLLLCLILILDCREIGTKYSRFTKPSDIFGMLLLVSVCIGVLISKSAVYTILWFSIGFNMKKNVLVLRLSFSRGRHVVRKAKADAHARYCLRS